MSKKEVKASELQKRVLTLMEQHVSLLEEEFAAHLKERTDDEIPDREKAKLPSYFSINLTSYIKSLTDYQEAQDEGIGRQLKALQGMSMEQIQKLKDDFDEGNI